MPKKISPKALLLSLCLITSPAFADDCQAIDQKLATALASANESSNYNDNPNEEKLENANQQIATIIQDFGTKNESINCPFSLAQQQHLRILTSDDNKFRAFSWDDNSGGTMHFFNQYRQFIDDKGQSHIEGGEDEGLIASLFTTTVQDKPLYLLSSIGIGSSKDTGESLDLYQIQGDTLTNPNLIKTKQGLTSQLNLEYNFFSVVDRPERPIKLFGFDEKSKTIRFPVVVEDKEFAGGKVTNRFIRYQFDGKYFVKK